MGLARNGRRIAVAFLAGGITVTSAWAGASLAPVPSDATDAAPRVAKVVKTKAKAKSKKRTATKRSAPRTQSVAAAPIDPASLADGQILAGAAKNSIEPRPKDYNGTWERDHDKCARLSPE